MTRKRTSHKAERNQRDSFTGPFEHDTVLPDQYFDSARQNLPEFRLMLAVLQDAVECYQKYALSRDPRGRFQFDEAKSWLMTQTDTDWPFSYENVCNALGMEADYIRRGLETWNSRSIKRQQTKREVRIVALGERRKQVAETGEVFEVEEVGTGADSDGEQPEIRGVVQVVHETTAVVEKPRQEIPVYLRDIYERTTKPPVVAEPGEAEEDILVRAERLSAQARIDWVVEAAAAESDNPDVLRYLANNTGEFEADSQLLGRTTDDVFAEIEAARRAWIERGSSEEKSVETQPEPSAHEKAVMVFLKARVNVGEGGLYGPRKKHSGNGRSASSALTARTSVLDETGEPGFGVDEVVEEEEEVLESADVAQPPTVRSRRGRGRKAVVAPRTAVVEAAPIVGDSKSAEERLSWAKQQFQGEGPEYADAFDYLSSANGQFARDCRAVGTTVETFLKEVYQTDSS